MAAPTSTVLPFGGGTLAEFQASDSTATEETSLARGPLATCNLRVAAGSPVSSPSWTAAATFWDRFYWNQFPAFSNAGDSLWRQYFNGSTEVARITINNLSAYGTATFKFYTLQSGTLTLVTTINQPMTTSGAAQVLGVMDVKIVSNTASGSLQVYCANSLQFSSGVLNHSGFSGVTSVTLGGGVFACLWSENICDTVSHVGDDLLYWSINANGTNTGWTGTYTNINELPTNDTAFIDSASANQISTFKQTGLSLTYNIVAMIVSARGKCDATGPQNLQLDIRTHATDYQSSSITGFNNGYSPCVNSWTTNPNTSAAWTAAEANAVEGGVKSIA